MKYICINPVTDGMYDADELNEFLRKYGYKRFETTGDWLGIVKEKYKMAVEQANHTVMDVRCPKAKELLEELGIISSVTVPKINPILIHCGQEGSEREDLVDGEKIITTPCQALADMGNELGMKDTLFISWNKFIEEVGDEPKRKTVKESPIPPGFFDDLELKIASLTGEEEIRDYFKDYVSGEVQLVEMLFCKDGCHNGDGVRMCENEEYRDEKEKSS